MGRAKHLLLLLLLTPLVAPLAGQGSELRGDFSHLLEDEPDFLPVDEAFVLTAQLGEDGSVEARWEMPDGYYLYRHRFAFQTKPESGVVLGAAEIPPGKKKVDEYFGDVEVYYHSARARVPVLSTGAGATGAGATIEVGITYQGCADRGLCYPPETRWIALTAASLPSSAASASATPAALESSSAPAALDRAITEEQRLARWLGGGNLLYSLAIFFVAGLALAFTPCVLPMVPILSSIIVGQGQAATGMRAFSLSLAYVLGMAITYASLGVLVGLFGASMNLQASLQAPAVLISFAVVFVALSLSMFGFYELRLPRFLQDRLDAASSRHSGGRHAGVAAMGALSALVVSPCVSAPLAGALIYLGSTGDAVLGGGALLALGLGMGTPLLVIGASGGHLMPRAGAWMETVKAVFGVLLLAVAVWLLERVVPTGVTLLLWSLLAMGAGVYLGALDFSPRRGWGQLWKATGAFAFIYGVLLLIGAASGAQDPLAPLAALAPTNAETRNAETRTSTVDLGTSTEGGVRASAATMPEESGWMSVRGTLGLDAALKVASAAGRPAVLDFYADWCIACKSMERSVFSAPEVEARLAEFTLLRADVTANDADDQALLDRFGLFGPPSLVFFDGGGHEVVDFRIQGEMDRPAFASHLDQLGTRLRSAPEI